MDGGATSFMTRGRHGKTKSTAALLIIDMTVEQTPPSLYKREAVIDTIRRVAVEGGFVDHNNVYDCRLWIKDPSTTSLTRIYPDVGIANTPDAALIPDLEQLFTNNNNIEFVPKTNYSAFFETELHSKLQQKAIEDVYITGVNTDYCVFATALDAYYLRYNVYVVEDGCTSIAGKYGHQEGLQRVRRHLPDPCVVKSNDVFNVCKKIKKTQTKRKN